MDVPRFPSLEDLMLDPGLRRMISERGGKVGVLDWIVQTNQDIPVLRHEVVKNISFSMSKRMANDRGKTLCFRSNNPCEYLPGTEGKFETVCVYNFDSASDGSMFKALKDLPPVPAPHLKKDWPKSKKDMMYGVSPLIDESFTCRLIEHPNRENVYWLTLSDDTQHRETFLSDSPNFPGKIWEKWDGELILDKLNKILGISKQVTKLKGMDERYAKQMEFIFNESTLCLAQAKILCPKNYVPLPSIDRTKIFEEELFQTFGIFDSELLLCDDSNIDISTRKEKVALLLRSPKRVSGAGLYYRPNISLAIFEWADGLLEHDDIPYFIYGEGVAVGKRSSRA